MLSVEKALKIPAGLWVLVCGWQVGLPPDSMHCSMLGTVVFLCCPKSIVLLLRRLPTNLELALFGSWGRRDPAIAPFLAPSKSSDFDPYRRGRPPGFSLFLRPETALQDDSPLLLVTLEMLADRLENCPLMFALLNFRITELAELLIIFSPRWLLIPGYGSNSLVQTPAS